MQVTNYTLKVDVLLKIELSDREKQVIDECRRTPHLQYWEKDELNLDEWVTLQEIKMVHKTVEYCIGRSEHNQGESTSMFRPTGKECREDVPGDGELEPVADDLYEKLDTLIDQWGIHASNRLPDV